MSRSRSFELGDQAERSTDHWTMPHSGPAITTLCHNSRGNPKRDEACEWRSKLPETQFMNGESGSRLLDCQTAPKPDRGRHTTETRRFRRAAEVKTRHRPI